MIGRYKAAALPLLLAAPLLLGASPAKAQFSLITTYTLPNNESLLSFDISWIDEFARVYLLADRSSASIDVIDLNTGNISLLTPTGAAAFQGVRSDPNVAGPNDVSGPNGVVTVNHAEVWAGDAPTFNGPIVQSADPAVAYAADNCDSSVKVFDLFSHLLTDVIDTGGCFRADEMAFDPVDQVFIVANPGEINIGKGPTAPFLTLISTKPILPGQSHPILAKIALDGSHGLPNATAGIEQPIYYPPLGYFLVALPQNGPNPAIGGVVVVDPRHRKVLGTIQVNNCSPNGAALNATNTELYLGCSAGPTQVISVSPGHLGQVLASFPQVQNCDEVTYNAGTNDFGGACGNNPSGPVVGVISAAGPTFVQDISTASFTKGNPHSITSDPVSGFFYVPLPTTDTQCPTANGCIAVYGQNPPS